MKTNKSIDKIIKTDIILQDFEMIELKGGTGIPSGIPGAGNTCTNTGCPGGGNACKNNTCII